MSSPNPNAPPPSYSIGAGAPVNQQHLQSQNQSQGMNPSEAPQQQLYYPQHPQQQQHLPPGHPDSYPPPPGPQFNPSTSDLHSQGGQQYPQPQPSQHMMSGGSGPPGQVLQQQYYPPPPNQQVSGSPQPPQQQEHHAPPAYQHTGGSSQDVKQYYAPPPGQQTPGSPQPPGQFPQQNYAPPTQHTPDGYNDAVPPPQPPRPNQQGALTTTSSGGYPVPPRRQSAQFGDDDPSSPIHYTRDPHKLVAYLVPFPKPQIKGIAPGSIPDRFLIYTPPPPPLSQPKEGEKEDKLHKVQRKWQQEVRSAKTSDAKTASWKGVKGKATKGIDYVMSKTTTSNLDFVNRIPGAKLDPKDSHADDGVNEGNTTHKTVGLEEMVLVYPSSYGASPDQVKSEFINTMMRTKSKAQKDAVIATGLLPVSAAIDIMATLVWPFGGLLEVDSVWAYSSIRGAKTARSVTKRLNSSTHSGNPQSQTEEQELQGDKLRMTFTQSPRLEVLYRYLVTRCRDYDHKHFPSTDVAPTETEVLAAIGWAPSQTGNVNKNWEDEEWETQEVKDDMKSTLGKAAKEWDKWCAAFAKNPEKALKK